MDDSFSYVEALMYLIYSYQYNKELLSKGQYRGHDEDLLGYYRRECLLVSGDLFRTACQISVGPKEQTNTSNKITKRECFSPAVFPCDPHLCCVTSSPLLR